MIKNKSYYLFSKGTPCKCASNLFIYNLFKTCYLSCNPSFSYFINLFHSTRFFLTFNQHVPLYPIITPIIFKLHSHFSIYSNSQISQKIICAFFSTCSSCINFHCNFSCNISIKLHLLHFHDYCQTPEILFYLHTIPLLTLCELISPLLFLKSLCPLELYDIHDLHAKGR